MAEDMKVILSWSLVSIAIAVFIILTCVLISRKNLFLKLLGVLLLTLLFIAMIIMIFSNFNIVNI